MSYSLNEEKKISRNSMRDPGNEALLLWSLSGSLLVFYALFGMPDNIIDWVGRRIDIMAFSIFFGAVAGGIIGLLHYLRVRSVVAKASFLNNEIMKAKKAKATKVRQEKIDAMQAQNQDANSLEGSVG